MQNIDMHVHDAGFSSAQTIRLHHHRDSVLHELHYFLEGEGSFRNGGVLFPVRPGSLFYSRPCDVHEARAADPGSRLRFYYLLFSGDGDGDGLVDGLGRRFGTGGPVAVGRGLTPVFEDIRRRGTSPEALIRRSADYRFLALLCDLAGRGPSQVAPRAGRYVEEALTLMQASIHSGLDLDALAGHLGIDKSYFVRLFKMTMGTPPMRYFLALRLDTAKHRLKNGDESLRTIARDLGFHDEFHFSHQFKTHVGQSPQAYRHQTGWPPEKS